MKTMQYKRLAIAMSVAGVISLGASTAQAVDFGASVTLENTLEVTVVNDMDLGTLFATQTGAALTNGVGAVVIAPDGVATELVTGTTDSATAELVSLGSPVGAQGSVAVTSDFNLVLPDTSTIYADDFVANGGTNTAIANITTAGTELVHESANPAVPSLYLMHFTFGDVSGGTGTATGSGATLNNGATTVAMDFGETAYVFNLGATVTTEPGTGTALDYQAGTYAGTFAVTAEY